MIKVVHLAEHIRLSYTRRMVSVFGIHLGDKKSSAIQCLEDAGLRCQYIRDGNYIEAGHYHFDDKIIIRDGGYSVELDILLKGEDVDQIVFLYDSPANSAGTMIVLGEMVEMLSGLAQQAGNVHRSATEMDRNLITKSFWGEDYTILLRADERHFTVTIREPMQPNRIESMVAKLFNRRQPF